MNSLGWSRRDAATPTANSSNNADTPILSKLSSLNPFGQGGYVRLPMYENEAPGAPLPARTRREEEEGWFARTLLPWFFEFDLQYPSSAQNTITTVLHVTKTLDTRARAQAEKTIASMVLQPIDARDQSAASHLTRNL